MRIRTGGYGRRESTPSLGVVGQKQGAAPGAALCGAVVVLIEHGELGGGGSRRLRRKRISRVRASTPSVTDQRA
jgi:hypothetical protein